MYVRSSNDQELTLVVSGMLWNRSLVMRDLETKSLWSHLMGKAMKGELKGTQLEAIPALMTDWETWKAIHPTTSATIMSRTAGNFNREMYRDLREFVVGMASPTDKKAWNLSDLKKQPLVNDSFGDQPILVYFDETNSTPFVYDRKLKDQVLTFEKRGEEFVDKESESTWDLRMGIATSGKFKDQRLTPMVGIPSFKTAWHNFYPESEYWIPAE